MLGRDADVVNVSASIARVDRSHDAVATRVAVQAERVTIVAPSRLDPEDLKDLPVLGAHAPVVRHAASPLQRPIVSSVKGMAASYVAQPLGEALDSHPAGHGGVVNAGDDGDRVAVRAGIN